MAKRLLAPTVKWSFISESLLPVDQPRIAALKSVSDRVQRLMTEKPTELPKIDWSYYKSRITLPGMVDTFQKGYEGLKIPYPSDQGVLSATESSNTEMIKFAESKLKELLEEVEKSKKRLKELESMMRFSDMTLEELYLARPDIRIDPDNPKQWPHALIEEHERSKAAVKDH